MMIQTIRFTLRKSTMEALSPLTGSTGAPRLLRLPARDASAALYLPRDRASLSLPLGFPIGEAFGAPLIADLRQTETHLLIDYTDALFSALVRELLQAYPRPTDDCGNHALNRALSHSRQPLPFCPVDPIIQRALLLALCLGEGVGLAQVEQAVEQLLLHRPVRDRAALQKQSAGVYAALARILYTDIKNTDIKKGASR